VYQGHNPVETFKIAQRLLKVWGIKPDASLTRLRKDIDTAYSKRNAIAHGAWFRIKRNDVRICLAREERITAIGPLDRRIIPEFAKRRVSQFRDDAKYILGVTTRVLELRKFVKAELQAWPRTVPSRLPRRPMRPTQGRSGKN
jgi:hypothetical protein